MLAADSRKTALGHRPAVPPRPLPRRERLLGHVFVFLIGSWNLVLVDLARPGVLWSPYVVSAWIVILLVHAAFVLNMAPRTASSE